MKLTSSLFIVCFFFVSNFNCHANSVSKQDTVAIIELNQKAWDARNTDLRSSKAYADEAVILSKKINYSRGLSYSYNMVGHYYKVKSNYDSAFYYFQQSLALRLQLKDTLNIAKSYRNIMSIYKLQGKNNLAIYTALSAMQLLLLLPNNAAAIKEKAWLQTNLAAIYLKTGEYSKATQNALESRSVFVSLNEDEGLASALMTLGNIYEEMENYSRSLDYFNEAIVIHNKTNNQRELAKAYNNTGNIYYATQKYSTALSAYNKSLSIREDLGFNDDIKGSLYNIGIIYDVLDKKDSALYFYEKSLSLSQESTDDEGQREAYAAIGALLLEQKKFDPAIQYLKKGLALANRSGALPEVLLLYKEITNAYRTAGNKDSTLIYSDKYTALNDSLNEVLRNSIRLASTIKEKEHELQMSEAKNNLQKIIIAAMCLILLCMLIIIVLFYRSYKAKRGLLRLQEIIKEQELRALDAMLEGEENERKRLALELHDTIGSILSATKYAFKSMENSLEKLLTENKGHYQKINGMLDEALENVRRISHDMASGVLVEKGIIGALQQLCDTLQTTGNIQIALNTHGFDQKTDYTTEVNLYRIIQELLTNIIKHSHAKQVNIQLVKSKKNINLVVDDDGKGFDPSDNNLRKGIGLSNIDKRVKKLAGKWNIDSGKGTGTTIVVDVPLNEEIN